MEKIPENQYSSDLFILKDSFVGSERDLINELIKSHFAGKYKKNDIKMLDIGIGIGENIKNKKEDLERLGLVVQLTGIDPLLAHEGPGELALPVPDYWELPLKNSMNRHIMI